MRSFLALCTLWLSWMALAKAHDFKIVCYFGSWGVYRTGNGNIAISDIDPTLCTHLIYTFVGITTGGEISILDPWADLADDGGLAGFQKFNALRELSPKTKTLVAIGGWNEGSSKYSTVVADASLRKKFVQNVVDFVLNYGFDGFDIDWEYPAQRGGGSVDVENYVHLLKELREAFDENDLILSAAVGAPEHLASLSYNIPEISKYLHFINLMLYDFHGSWDGTTGHNAPLYAAERERTEAERKLNVDTVVNYWLTQGAPREKLILGTGFYGRTFTLTNSAENAPGSAASGAGQGGPYTSESGMLGYNEICEYIKEGDWTVVWDEEQRVPYAYSGDQWVSYDDVRSITEKAEYARDLGLGGAMLWSIETDDFRGICGAEKFPLLTALNAVLRHSITHTLPETDTETSDNTDENNVSEDSEAENENEIHGNSEEESDEKTENTNENDVIEDTKTEDENEIKGNPEEDSVQKTENTNENNVTEDPKTQDENENEINGDPEELSDSLCTEAGPVRDSQDCSKFWLCQATHAGYSPISLSCPTGLRFDSTTKTCNYADLVDC